MIRISIAITLVMLTVSGVHAKLRDDPAITSVALDPTDSDKIAIRISGLPCEAAVSTNAGQSFVAVGEQDVQSDWSPVLAAGSRRYVLADAFHVLRSDDAGATWTNTAATSFLRARSEAAVEEEATWFREDYGSRLPPRSPLWHPLFAAFALGHLLVTFLALRHDGSLRAILIGLRGLVVLSLVWILLWGFHAVVTNWIDAQFPRAYWSTWAQRHPSPKLGLAMTITALPLPLLAYLAFLWPILPGSSEVLSQLFPENRRRLSLAICVVAGSAFALFHLCMMFIGCFLE